MAVGAFWVYEKAPIIYILQTGYVASVLSYLAAQNDIWDVCVLHVTPTNLHTRFSLRGIWGEGAFG